MTTDKSAWRRRAMIGVLALACSCTGEVPVIATVGEEPEDHDNGHEHEKGHAHGEVSDMDQTVEQLFSTSCEHGIRAFECDECRYEVGVVKAPAVLADRGLVSVVSPREEILGGALTLNGEVRFDERLVTHVSPMVRGIIRRVHVNLGDRVSRGDPLLEIDSSAVWETRAEFLDARATLGLAREINDRVESLHAKGISAKEELERTSQEVAAARIRFDAARGKLARLGGVRGGPGNHALRNGRLVLESPSDGTILAMHAVAGEVATAEAPLATIGDNSSLWVWADVYERDIAAVRRGLEAGHLEAKIRVGAFPEATFPGRVDFMSPSMDEASRTVKLRIEVPNERGRLLAGMFATVELSVPGDGSALTLPTSAVLEDEGRRFVFVRHSGDYFVRRPVVPGREAGDRTEIATGLTGDETVIADGAFLMKSDVLRSKMGAGCAD